MNILEEFWYGNLDPAEYDASPSEEYRELIRLLSRNEEKLLATITQACICPVKNEKKSRHSALK